MKMKRLLLFLAWLFVAASAVTYFYISVNYRKSPMVISGELPFPFVIEKPRTNYPGDAFVFIPPEHYSKTNLDALFTWYYHKHIKNYRNLRVYLFIDRLEMEQYIEEIRNQPKDSELIQFNEDQNNASNQVKQSHKSPIVAECYGSTSELLLESDADPSSSGFNLFYRYIPNLGQPNLYKKVILRGITSTEGKYDMQKQSVSNGNNKITISAYNIYNVEPAGKYYSFTWDSKTDSGRPRSRVIFIIQQEEVVPLPTNQIGFLTDKISYAYMGWMYSVTIDQGKTWRLWSAEKDLLGWKCCDPNLIKSVSISPDGNGRMTLRPDPTQPEKLTYLQTSDFGQKWKLD